MKKDKIKVLVCYLECTLKTPVYEKLYSWLFKENLEEFEKYFQHYPKFNRSKEDMKEMFEIYLELLEFWPKIEFEIARKILEKGKLFYLSVFKLSHEEYQYFLKGRQEAKLYIPIEQIGDKLIIYLRRNNNESLFKKMISYFQQDTSNSPYLKLRIQEEYAKYINKETEKNTISIRNLYKKMHDQILNDPIKYCGAISFEMLSDVVISTVAVKRIQKNYKTNFFSKYFKVDPRLPKTKNLKCPFNNTGIKHWYENEFLKYEVRAYKFFARFIPIELAMKQIKVNTELSYSFLDKSFEILSYLKDNSCAEMMTLSDIRQKLWYKSDNSGYLIVISYLYDKEMLTNDQKKEMEKIQSDYQQLSSRAKPLTGKFD